MSDHARKVLNVSGPDARTFLQGLVTNDVARLDAGLVYAALLTPQGKLRCDFFLVPDGENILIDVAADQAASLMQVLTLYKLRSDVAIAETDRQVSRGTGPAPTGAFVDPRDPRMGWRGYDGQPDQPADWDALRVACALPEMGIELGPDTFILEAGFERLNGVDFKKGCYVGQEVTARMKHKTELRKGLAQVQVTGTAPVGSDITKDGKPVGTLFTQSRGQAIAYLRFDRATGEMIAGDATVRYDG